MPSIFERVFTFLFKYPPRVFQRADLVLAPVVPLVALAVLLGVVLILVVLMTRNLRVRKPVDRIVLAALRVLVFLLVAGCLVRPTLALSSAVSQRNVVAVLLDDSRSMTVRDVGGRQRLEVERAAFADSARIVRRLGQRFALRFFRFGADATPVAGTTALAGSGTRTDLAAALETARQELSDVPVAGMVVVTDGADNGGGSLETSLLALRTRHLPVYPVGVGEERFDKDIAIERVDLPPTTLEGAGAGGAVSLSVRGVGGDSTDVVVEADGRIVASTGVRLARGRDVVEVPVRLPPLAVGTHVIDVRVAPIKGEVVTENNETQAMVRVRPGREKVLYVDGSPRPEVAFIRRAVADDSALQLVTLLRSARGKFLRLGVDDSLELLSGFPTRRSDLYRYRVLVLGDIEASFFTGDQLQMLADFVDRRGGTLIALGGRSALAEGGYSGTYLAEALPVTLGGVPRLSDSSVLTLSPVLTPAGKAHPALRLGATEAASLRRWDSLPSVTAVNAIGGLKPGATLLIDGEFTGGGHRPILAWQRYGRGITEVLGVQDTWLWKMDPRTPPEDRTYEMFWRQMLRWALDQVPDQVEVTASPQHAGPNEPVAIEARVTDSIYMDVNDASVTAQLRTPSGRVEEIPLEWTLRDDGTYTGHFTPEEQGTYQVTAVAVRGRDSTRSGPAGLLVDPRGADMAHVELRTPLLRHIAEATGGKYYPIGDLGTLPDDMVLTESGITTRESRDLWDMPVVLLSLLALLGLDWGYRRWRGLA